MIAVIDYGMGNLRSVQKALERTGFDARVTSAARDIEDARGVVLPGVGAFRDCMLSLDRQGLIEPVRSAIASGKPFLGICLGLQVLFAQSEEFGICEGLGVFPGKVVRFPGDMADPEAAGAEATRLKVPHMGWNQLVWSAPCPLMEGLTSGTHFYFVHSYYVDPLDSSVTCGTCDYGGDFTAMIWRDHLFATQFHPEKSQKAGLTILKNFAAL